VTRSHTQPVSFSMTRDKSALAHVHIAGIARIGHGLVGACVDARVGAIALCAVAALHCEPVDEAPPPGTATTGTSAPGAPPPGAPPMPTAPPPGVTLGPTGPPPGYPSSAAAAIDASAPAVSYASGEYAIGVDPDSYDDSDRSALTDFRAALDPYGSWADDPAYGMVWTPSPDAAGAGFAPYVSSGHWAYDDDWVWVSDYPWGWAPFHYGRWALVAGRGWSWIPGRAYRGAWVTWAVDDGNTYLGWAPLAPEFVWIGGIATARHDARAPQFVYCPRAAVFAPEAQSKVVVGPAAIAIAARMHLYVAVAAGGRALGGPPPARFGYAAAQVPRPAGAGAAGVERAEQFARRSTAGAGPSAGAGAGAGPSAGARPPLMDRPLEAPKVEPGGPAGPPPR